MTVEAPASESLASARDRWLGVELRHLAALEAIMREGTFRGAADSLGYVQSAVSQQVAHLELLVGTRLVDRSRGTAPVALTEAGDLLLRHVEVILARLDAAQADLAALLDGSAGFVRVGAFQSVATRVLPHVLPSFAESFPLVRISPTETRTDGPLLALVEHGQLDLAFCEVPLADSRFECVELMDDPFVLLVSATSPLAAQEEAPPLEELGRIPLVGFNHSRSQDRMVAMLRSRGVKPSFTFLSDLNATVQSLVAADIGAAIVPYLCVDPHHPGTTVLELPELAPRKIALIWRRDQELSSGAALFVDAVRATCERRFRH